MNNVKKRLLYFSTYRSIFLRFIILSILIISVVSIILFFLFYRSSEKEVRNISNQMLHQTSFVTNIINEQVYNIGNHLINNRKVINAMYNNEVDRIEEYHAVTLMKDIQSTFPFIHSIGIYNDNTGRYMNTKGYTVDSEHALFNGVSADHKQSYIRFLPRKVKDLATNREQQLLTFILSPSYTSYLPKNGVIIINFNEQYVHNIIGNLNSSQSNKILLVDSKGDIISESDGNKFLDNIADQSFLKEISSMEEMDGNFITKIDEKRSLVSFVKSKDFEWTIISINHYQDLMYNLRGIQKYIGITAIIIFLLSIAFSVRLTNVLYSPINKLMNKLNHDPVKKRSKVNEFQEIGKNFSQISEKLNYLEPSVDIIKKSYLLDYINGSKADIESHYHQMFTNSSFTVILIKIDLVNQYKEKNSQYPALIQLSIYSIIEEIMGSEIYETLIMKEDEIGVIELDGPQLKISEMIKMIEKVHQTIRDQLNTSVTIGIGERVESIGNIRQSYLQAIEAVNQRFINGRGKTFWYSEEMTTTSTIDFQQTNEIDKKIMGAIHTGNEDIVVEEFKKLSLIVREFNYNQVMFIYNKVLYGLHKRLQKLDLIDKEPDQLMDVIINLKKYHSLEELSNDITDICTLVSGHFREKSKNKNIEIIESIKLEIDEHFSDPNISLKGLADRVKMTPGYLGKLFNSYYNISFNDYLKDVRLEKSRELLLLTNKSVKLISEEVGIPNSTYFYTLFRKKNGISPARYRSMMGISENLNDIR